MNPKALVGVLSAVNLLVGIGLGIAADRLLLTEQPAAVEPAPEAAGVEPVTTTTDPEAKRDGERDRHRRDRRRHRRGPGGHVKWLRKSLDLDDTQAEKIKTILQSKRPRFEAIFKDVRPRLQELEEQTRAEVRAVLTAEQQAKLDEMQKAFRGKRRRGMWGPMGGPPKHRRGERGDRSQHRGDRPPPHDRGDRPRPHDRQQPDSEREAQTDDGPQ